MKYRFKTNQRQSIFFSPINNIKCDNSSRLAVCFRRNQRIKNENERNPTVTTLTPIAGNP